MYLPQRHLIVLETPKCGSRTLVQAAKNQYGSVLCPGHKSLSYTLDWLDRKNKAVKVNISGVYRDPVERFLSSLNYTANRDPKCGIDHAVMELQKEDHRRDTVYRSQSYYWDFKNITYKYETPFIVDISRVEELLKHMGYEGPELFCNRSNKLYGYQDIKNLVSLIEKTYSRDYDLLRRIQ
jgi:hypothetical protein